MTKAEYDYEIANLYAFIANKIKDAEVNIKQIKDPELAMETKALLKKASDAIDNANAGYERLELTMDEGWSDEEDQ